MIREEKKKRTVFIFSATCKKLSQQKSSETKERKSGSSDMTVSKSKQYAV